MPGIETVCSDLNTNRSSPLTLDRPSYTSHGAIVNGIRELGMRRDGALEYATTYDKAR